MNTKQDLTPFPFRMNTEIRNKLEALAKKNKRSIQGELEAALLNHLDKSNSIEAILDIVKNTERKLSHLEDTLLDIKRKIE